VAYRRCSAPAMFLHRRPHGRSVFRVVWEWPNTQRFSFANGRRHGTFEHRLPDGTLKKKEVYIQGVHIPADIYRRINNKQLTAKDILDMKNAAIRRICLEQLGYARFLAQMEHQIIEKDGEYELVRIYWHEREEPICLVKVKCPSTGAFYTLRVPRMPKP